MRASRLLLGFRSDAREIFLDPALFLRRCSETPLNPSSSLTLDPWVFPHLNEVCQGTPRDKPFVTFAFCFRSFKKRSKSVALSVVEDGFILSRECSDISFLAKSGEVKQADQIRESRYASVLKLYPDQHSPCFSIIIMSDIDGLPRVCKRCYEMDEAYGKPLGPFFVYLDTTFEALFAAWQDWDQVLRMVESANDTDRGSRHHWSNEACHARSQLLRPGVLDRDMQQEDSATTCQSIMRKHMNANVHNRERRLESNTRTDIVSAETCQEA